MEFEVVQGDIAQLEADGLVNAANTELAMGTGVAGALREAGGEALNEAAVAAGPIGLGEAVATDAYELDATHVLHAAAMEPGGRATEESVRDATRDALELADELGCESLAVPAIGTGAAGLPFEAGARSVSEVIAAFDPRSLTDVCLVVYTDEDRETARRVAATVRGES